MRKIIVSTLFSIFLLGCATSESTAPESADFKFGVLVGDSMETLDIRESKFVFERKIATKLPYFGFKIVPGHNYPFSLQTVLYPPSEPNTMTGNFKGSPKDYEKGIESKINTFQGVTVIGYRLEPGDPYGEYKLLIIVNGKAWKQVKYTLVPENA